MGSSILIMVVVVAIIAVGTGLFMRALVKIHWLKQQGNRI